MHKYTKARTKKLLKQNVRPSPQERLVVMLNALLRRWVEGDAEGFVVRAGWRLGFCVPQA